MNDERTPEERARQQASRLGLDDEKTARFVEAYPVWEARQPPDTDDEDWQEWREARDDTVTEFEWKSFLPGHILLAPDQELLDGLTEASGDRVSALIQVSNVRVAVPDYHTEIAFKPAAELTEADLQAIWVGQLIEGHTARVWGDLIAWMGEHGEDGETLGEIKERRRGEGE